MLRLSGVFVPGDLNTSDTLSCIHQGNQEVHHATCDDRDRRGSFKI